MVEEFTGFSETLLCGTGVVNITAITAPPITDTNDTDVEQCFTYTVTVSSSR
jgi:hypothetical protein